VADIHTAQNYTLGLMKYNDLMPLGGWGVNFKLNSNTYTIFADLDAPPPGPPGYMRFDEDTEGNTAYGARVTTLPPEVEISSLVTVVGSATSTNEEVNVTFLPPDPRTNIYRVDYGATSTSLLIGLREKASGKIRTVRVNFLGLVEVINED
jgi:hypothetical protein